jgi:uncharacterized lipoprotein YmbA
VDPKGDEMMPLLFFRLTLLTIVALLMHLAGCASSAPTRFYVLSPLASSTSDSQVPKDEGCIAIGIGPVELPAYLDRPQIVTRVSENELNLSEFNKWAEPLKDNLTRVLVENLSTLICADAISIFPWKGPTPIDYQVEVTVIRMDGSVGGNASLVARWAIFREKDRKMLMMRQSSFSRLLSSQGYQALVSAQSGAIAALSRESAEAIKTYAFSVDK